MSEDLDAKPSEPQTNDIVVQVFDPATKSVELETVKQPRAEIVLDWKAILRLSLVTTGKALLWCLKNPDVFLKWGLVILVVKILKTEGFTLETLVRILRFGE